MQTKTVCRFARIPRTVCLIALSAVIFTGILVLMVFALALTANGMITLPSAFIRIIGKGSIFVSCRNIRCCFSERQAFSSGLG